MPTTNTTCDPVEEKLRTFVEGLLGGKVMAMHRLLRWRPAWNLELQRDGETLQLHIRGERGGDVSPFPDLRREADILSLLGQQGVPVPHIYGFCEDPQAILMQLVPGSRDVRTAKNDVERHGVARQWVDAMARMHQLPLQPFIDQGISLPKSAEDITLAGLEAYYPLYARNKTRPQPLAEFALGWLRRNVPQHRTRPSFVQYDSGQFLFENGQVHGLYDFEFAMIGDPLADLASARMRDNYEPLGDSFAALYSYYQQVTGEPAEPDVVRYHTALFATVSTMQFSASVATPQPGDPHDTYTEFDIALRRVVVHALAEAMGIALEVPTLDIVTNGPNAQLLTMLSDALAQVEVGNEFQQTKLRAVSKLVEYLGRGDAMELHLRALEQQEAQALLDRTFSDYDEIEAALEAFVKSAGPEYDEPLLRLFMVQIERRVLVYGSTAIGASASHIDLPPVD
ncbi:phosphotransferase family protein [Pseudomonas sp. ACN5]|uniref:phosphotransferase family protein n=1 Tax=Pseudomonas sp. ACN5 TaxID=1920427 RepID=UPI000BB37E82|nr:phosphotransferase family protein [Pseudomonas sp. ACN5]PBJ02512.1 Phosphotransferase enzyme family protein [Pseudomonas sp. ACN5]